VPVAGGVEERRRVGQPADRLAPLVSESAFGDVPLGEVALSRQPWAGDV